MVAAILNICFYLGSVVNSFTLQYQCHNMSGFYYGFEQPFTASKFGTEYWRGFLRSPQRRFSRIDLDFFPYFSKKSFSNFCTRNSFIPWYLLNEGSGCLFKYFVLLLFFKTSFFHIGTIVSFFCHANYLKFVCLS